jgi:PhnB protein
MAFTSIYLNFNGNAEEAFNHYKKVFKTEFAGPMMKMKDAPPNPNVPAIPDAEKNKVMHVALPLLGGTLLMATDTLDSMGHKLVEGNNFTISLSPDTHEEADRLYKELSGGGKEDVAPHEEFWGYWGTCKDRFGIRWMFNVMKPMQQ